MKKQSNPWDKHLGKRLQNLQPEPALDAWDRIEAELESKPRRMAWWWVAAAASLLAVPTAFYAWQMTGQDFTAATSVANHTIVENSQATAESKQVTPIEILEIIDGKKQKTSSSPNTVANVNPTNQTRGSNGPEQAQLSKKSAPEAGETATGNPINSVSFNSNATSSIATTPNTKAKTSPSDPIAVPLNSTEIASVLKSRPASGSALKIDEATAEDAGMLTSPLSESTNAGHAEMPATQKANGPVNTIASVAPKSLPLKFSVKAPAYIPSYYSAASAKQQLAEVDKKKVENTRRESKTDRQARMWVEAMPTWSYRRIEPSQTDGVVITSLEEQPALSSDRMGGQLAAGVAYPITKKLKWKSGAYYWYQQQRWSYSYHDGKASSFKASFDQAETLSLTPQFNEQTQTVDMTLHNIGLSTGLSLQMPTKFAASSLETKVLAQYNAYQSISSLVSMGYFIEANLSDNTKISVGPSLQLQLNNNQNTNSHFDEKPLSAGIQMGVAF